MEVLDKIYITDILHSVAEFLLIPVVVLLLAFIVYSLYSLGSLMVEMVIERRHYRAKIPRLVALIETSSVDDLPEVIDSSDLLCRQKDDLDELVCYLYLPEDGRTEVAKRLLANEDMHDQRILDRTEMASKTAPMLGLMGTLIPLGPGIIALGTGDVETLSNALLMAFDTTVAGLATAVVCFIITKVRRRWYADYLVSMEAAFNAILEKARIAHEEGYVFPQRVFEYSISGRKAKAVPLEDFESENAGDDTDGGDDGFGSDDGFGGDGFGGDGGLGIRRPKFDGLTTDTISAQKAGA